MFLYKTKATIQSWAVGLIYENTWLNLCNMYKLFFKSENRLTK